MTKLAKPFIFIFVLCSMAACKRGCTTSSTLDAERNTVTVNGVDFEVTARLIEYRHSRRQSGGALFDRTVTYSHMVAFDLATPWWADEEVAYENVGDPDDVDLEAALTRFHVSLSADKNHFAYGASDKVLGIYHVLAGHGFTNTRSFSAASSTQHWADLELDTLPTPAEMFSRMFGSTEACSFSGTDGNVIAMVLNDLPITDTLQLRALHAWPNCNAVDRYLTPQRINELSTDPTWKTAAIDRAIFVMDDGQESFFGSDEALELIVQIGDAQAYAGVDSIYDRYWGHNGHGEATDYILERFGNSAVPMAAETREKIVNRARTSLTAFLNGEAVGHGELVEAMYAMRILLMANETEAVDAFFAQCYDMNFWNDEFFDIEEVFEYNYDLMGADRQQEFLTKSQELLPDTRDYLRENVFEMIAPYADCQVLQDILNTYRDDMQYVDIPERCPHVI